MLLLFKTELQNLRSRERVTCQHACRKKKSIHRPPSPAALRLAAVSCIRMITTLDFLCEDLVAYEAVRTIGESVAFEVSDNVCLGILQKLWLLYVEAWDAPNF